MNFQKQKGVALAVGLVMLLILTIMGISSMSNTTLELKIACNSQTHNDAFQAAMSCVNESIVGVNRSGPWPQNNNCIIANSNTSAAVEITSLGCRVIKDNSLELTAAENVYEVRSVATATGCGGEAYSNIVQAIAIRSGKTCSDQP